MSRGCQGTGYRTLVVYVATFLSRSCTFNQACHQTQHHEGATATSTCNDTCSAAILVHDGFIDSLLHPVVAADDDDVLTYDCC